MTHRLMPLALFVLLLGLAGCATGPRIDETKFSPSITPDQAARSPDDSRGRAVLWGGTIVNSSNLEEGTRVEVLSYPLGSSQRPDVSQPSQGRFLVMEKGYLETADYAPGRLVTVAGTVTDTRDGQIGQARYVYPVLAPDRLYLWPQDSEEQANPSFHIGVGVILGN